MEPRGNLLRLYYADMRHDLAGGFARIAKHIEINHPADPMTVLIDAANFQNMKANADRFAIAAGNGFWRNDAGFFDSATSNKWQVVLSDDGLAAYDARRSELLDADQRHWLEWGSTQP